MCEWILRSYRCGHGQSVASVWCRSYIVRGKRCKVEHTSYEWLFDELCLRCRRKTTDQQRAYIRDLHNDLVRRYPKRDWSHIGALADLPDLE